MSWCVSTPPSAARGGRCSSWASVATSRCGIPSAGAQRRLRHQTITFDAPGVGESTVAPPASHGRPRAHGRPPHRRLGYETVDVLGVSFGGARSRGSWRQSPVRSAGSCSPPRPPGAGARKALGRPSADVGAGDARPATTRPSTSPRSRRRSMAGGSGASPRADGRAGPRAMAPSSVAARACRPALCDELVDQPSVAAVHQPSDARDGRGRRSDHPGVQRAHPG